ncbi:MULTISPECIES: helix-turn-helix transcriptional regulator [unclassified Thiocapsa]|uniref:helix-turn-helix transcriptional regulator n=1 Tax=unclassified Thiocapsa TaxID=2641286 RepID=UPI0035B310B6
MSNTLARNLRKLRVSAGLSQDDLAERTGLSQTWISRLESGGANPTIETLSSIAEALEIRVHDLFNDQPEAVR